MKENKYDDEIFFEKYSQMPRSSDGLKSAGEWYVLKSMLPDFNGKHVLDLGCGFGWHSIYAAKQGAASVVGVDISEKMLAKAKEQTCYSQVNYIRSPIEDYEYTENSFDVVISSLAFHYIASFEDICVNVNRCLVNNGDFVFSVEHPVFTAHAGQDWIYDESGHILYWPVDMYFTESGRDTCFLGEYVRKYHRTLTTYINCLLCHGFSITGFNEPTPIKDMLEIKGTDDELRRPMMLIISAKKRLL